MSLSQNQHFSFRSRGHVLKQLILMKKTLISHTWWWVIYKSFWKNIWRMDQSFCLINLKNSYSSNKSAFFPCLKSKTCKLPTTVTTLTSLWHQFSVQMATTWTKGSNHSLQSQMISLIQAQSHPPTLPLSCLSNLERLVSTFRVSDHTSSGSISSTIKSIFFSRILVAWWHFLD